MDIVRDELEALTHQITQGDITPLVYQLLKDTQYVEDLYTYKTLMSEGGKKQNVHKQNTSRPTKPESDNRISFAEWVKRRSR